MKFFIGLLLSISTLLALTNTELAQKSKSVMDGFEDSISTMQMRLINAAGQEKVRTMEMKVLEGENEDKSLMEFLSPADVKGTKFLSYEHIDKDDDQWLYLPALKRVKRIASKNKSGAFMGSEFSYEDLGQFNPEKYRYKGEPKEATLKGKKVYISPAIPISKYSGYTKLVSYIDKDTFLVQKIEYFDRKHELLKVEVFDGYRKINGVYRIKGITMRNVQNDKTTILKWSDERIKNGLTAKDFKKRYLMR